MEMVFFIHGFLWYLHLTAHKFILKNQNIKGRHFCDLGAHLSAQGTEVQFFDFMQASSETSDTAHLKICLS